MTASVVPDLVCHVDDTGFYLGERQMVARFLGVNPNRFKTNNIFGLIVPQGSITLIALPDVRFLWRSLRQLRRAIRPDADTGDQTVYLLMPCGFGTRYIAFDDLPWHDTPCPCGNPDHYLIRYSDPLG